MQAHICPSWQSAPDNNCIVSSITAAIFNWRHYWPRKRCMPIGIQPIEARLLEDEIEVSTMTCLVCTQGQPQVLRQASLL